MIKVKCLNCNHEQELKSYSIDKLGYHVACDNCGSSFDVNPENEHTITERCLSFKYSGDNQKELSLKLAKLLEENHIDYVCYDHDSNYYPSNFIIRKCSFKWNNLYGLINSVKAAKYDFIKSTFYITRRKREVLGNIQEVVILN